MVNSLVALVDLIFGSNVFKSYAQTHGRMPLLKYANGAFAFALASPLLHLFTHLGK